LLQVMERVAAYVVGVSIAPEVKKESGPVALVAGGERIRWGVLPPRRRFPNPGMLNHACATTGGEAFYGMADEGLKSANET